MKLKGKISINGTLQEFEFEGTPADLDTLQTGGGEQLKEVLTKLATK